MKVAVLMINDFPRRVFKGHLKAVHEYARAQNKLNQQAIKKAGQGGVYPSFQYYHVHVFEVEFSKDLLGETAK